MIRAAAKNHALVAVVASPDSTPRSSRSCATPRARSRAHARALAAAAFALHRALRRGDRALARRAARTTSRRCSRASTSRSPTCAYGENPHQRAAYYAQAGARTHLLSRRRQLHGKELSFNNLLDLDAARAPGRASSRSRPCVIVKHNNPCGAAVGRHAARGLRRALACDPVSAFGGIIVLNRPVDARARRALPSSFVEVLFAPGYDEDALEILTQQAEHPDPERPGAAPSPIAELDLRRVERRPARAGPRRGHRGARRDAASSPSARPTEARVGRRCCSPGGSAST